MARPPERIAELMDKMREAMDKFMQAMREEAERRMKDGSLPRQQSQQGRAITPEDLQKMMDALEDLAKGGSREMAEQLLNELDRLLQNMQPGMSDQAQGDNGMGEMMDQLGDMMKRQQGLMDETQRQPGSQGEDGDMGEQGEQGEEGNRGKAPGNGMGGLADRQRSLQQMLDDLLGQGRARCPANWARPTGPCAVPRNHCAMATRMAPAGPGRGAGTVAQGCGQAGRADARERTGPGRE
jgi:hypothetical protein